MADTFRMRRGTTLELNAVITKDGGTSNITGMRLVFTAVHPSQGQIFALTSDDHGGITVTSWQMGLATIKTLPAHTADLTPQTLLFELFLEDPDGSKYELSSGNLVVT